MSYDIGFHVSETPWKKIRSKWFRFSTNNYLIWPGHVCYVKDYKEWSNESDIVPSDEWSEYITAKEYLIMKIRGVV